MAALRCSTCGINYPNIQPSLCLVCEERLMAFPQEEVDEDWETRVRLLRKRREGDTPEQIHPNQDATVTIFAGPNGWLYLSHEDLLGLGYSYLESFSIVRVNGKFFELQGYDRKRGVWWVEPVEPEAIEEAAGWVRKFFGRP